MNTTINRRYNIVGIGELLWDMLPEDRRLGGAPANFAIHARALGANARIVSAVGRDSDGQDILESLTHKQVPTDLILRNSRPTGKVLVHLDASGHPSYTIEQNAAWDFMVLSAEAQQLAGVCDAICFGSLAQRNLPSRLSIHQFLIHTPEHCLRIFDINLRQNYYSKEIIEMSLGAANVLKLNDDELVVLREILELPESEEQALRTMMERYNLRYIALTRGADGSLMMSPEQTVQCAGTPLTVQDTIGAGDSFTAAMALGILNGLPLDIINRNAGHVAAYVCSHAGATPDLPAWLVAEFHRKTTVPIQTMSNPPSPELKKQIV
ncbi:MAG: carbohydrate kinase [Sedimentisphaerales bacterium]|nr:carbohydrate kinase [Sedimentisphaerales bacterium]